MGSLCEACGRAKGCVKAVEGGCTLSAEQERRAAQPIPIEAVEGAAGTLANGKIVAACCLCFHLMQQFFVVVVAVKLSRLLAARHRSCFEAGAQWLRMLVWRGCMAITLLLAQRAQRAPPLRIAPVTLHVLLRLICWVLLGRSNLNLLLPNSPPLVRTGALSRAARASQGSAWRDRDSTQLLQALGLAGAHGNRNRLLLRTAWALSLIHI